LAGIINSLDKPEINQIVRGTLRQLRRQTARAVFVDGLIFGNIVFWFLLFIAFWNNFLSFPVLAFYFSLAIAFIYFFIIQYRRLNTLLKTYDSRLDTQYVLLREIAERQDEYRDLLTIFELTYYNPHKLAASAALQKIAVLQLPDFAEALPNKIWSIRATVLSVGLFTIAYGISGNQVFTNIARLMNYNEANQSPLATATFLADNLKGIEEEELVIAIAIDSNITKLDFVVEDVHGIAVFEETLQGNRNRDTLQTSAFKLLPGAYIATLLAQSELQQHSDSLAIQVLALPFVKNYVTTIMPPKYTGKPTEEKPNASLLTLYPGSRIQTSFEINKPLIKAWMTNENGLRQALTTSGNEASYSGRVKRENVFRFGFIDADSLVVSPAPSLLFRYFEDFPPAVRLLRPDRDIRLIEVNPINLMYEIDDDFGISEVQLFYRVNTLGMVESDFSGIQLLTTTETELPALKEYLWPLPELALFDGDVVEFFLKVWDNNTVESRKIAYSDTIKISLPSMFENIIAEEQTDQKIDKSLTEVLRDAGELQKQMSELKMELLQKEKLDFNQRQKIRDALEKQQKLIEEVENLKKQISDKVRQMEENQTLSEETLEQYDQIQKMLDELLPDDLKQKLAEMQKKMDDVNRDEINNFMQQSNFDKKDFTREIERIHELMKKMMLMNQLDNLAKQYFRLSEKQKDITELLRNDNFNKAARREESMANDLDALQKKQNAVFDSLSDQSSLKEQLQKLAMDSSMQALLKQIEDQSPGSQQSSDEMARAFAQAGSMMNQSKSGMQQAQKKEIIEKINQAFNETIRYSQKQEEILQQSQELSDVSLNQQALARRQVQAREQLQSLKKQLTELSNETFFLPKDAFKVYNAAEKAMDQAAENMSQQRARESMRDQRNAMGHLNQMARQLLQTMQSAQNSQSGSGAESFMKMLQQMAGMQGSLNQQGMQMLQQGGNGQQMQGLANKQRAIRDALQNAREKYGEQQGLSGRMGQVQEEMEKIAREIETGRLNAAVIKRQEKLFDQLLDAQKSMRKKEFSKKREAQNALPYVYIKPESGDLPAEKRLKWEKYYKQMSRENWQEETIQYFKDYYEALP
jgi:hypothetical protein